MPPDLDVSRILILSLDQEGAPTLHRLNVGFAPAHPPAGPEP
jgi:hypothetical protein